MRTWLWGVAQRERVWHQVVFRHIVVCGRVFPRFSTSMIVIYAVLIMLGGVISYLYVKFPPSESPARARPHSVKKEKRLRAEANQKQSQNKLIS